MEFLAIAGQVPFLFLYFRLKILTGLVMFFVLARPVDLMLCHGCSLFIVVSIFSLVLLSD